MSKFRMVERVKDPLLVELGKTLSITQTPNGPELAPPSSPSLTSQLKVIEWEDLTIPPAEGNSNSQMIFPSKTTTVKLIALSSDGINTILPNFIPNLNFDFHNHNLAINKPQNISLVQTQNLNQTIASYDAYTHINYFNKKYEEATSFIDEKQIPPAWANVRKQDFTKSPFAINSLPDQYDRIIFPGDNSKEEFINQFPYYNTIQISNKTTNQFSDGLTRLGISSNFLTGYLNSTHKSMIDYDVQDGSNVPQTLTISVFDVLSWIRTGALDEGLYNAGGMFWKDRLGDRLNLTSLNLRKNVLAGIVRDLAINNFRSFGNILDGNLCYTEDYAYEMKKYKDYVIGSPFQTIYKSATEESSVIKDTQIKYGQKYIYQVGAFYLIIGTTYRYTDIRYNLAHSSGVNTSGPVYSSATVTVISEPSMIMVPVNLFTSPVVVIQPPPIYPKVKFATKNNSDNKIQMYLSPTQGRLYEDFTLLTPEDQSQLSLMQIDVPSNQTVNGFKFETIAESGLYEIFKMNTAPKLLTDFSDKKLTEIRMSYNSPNAVFEDNVRANRKYYYLFRKVNERGLVSNPTSIYEVELIVDADDSKIVINDYELPVLPTSQKSHKFKSLFQIEPAVEQTIFDNAQPALFERESVSGVLDNLTLGIAEQTVWDRKFKFRIKSTTSGKIIDYNITFKLTKDKTEEDFN